MKANSSNLQSGIASTYFIILFLICAGFAISLISFVGIQQGEQAKLQTQFINGAKERILSLKQDISSNIHDVVSLGAFYHASEIVSRNEFHRYLQPLLARAEAIQALEWIPKVAYSEKQRFEENARAEGQENFLITERLAQGDMVPVKRRDAYFPVYYLKPAKGNELALGFDLSSNPERWITLKKSRDSGQLLITERITLVQEKATQYGFLAFLPIYQQSGPLVSVKSRRQALKGFVLGVFRLGDILKHALSHMTPVGIDFYLYDLEAEASSQFLAFHSAIGAKEPNAETVAREQLLSKNGLEYSEVVHVGGRKWQIIASPSEGYFTKQISTVSWLSLIFGLTVTALLAVYIALIWGRYEQARKHADKVRASENLLRYQASHDGLTDLVNRSEFEIRLKQAIVSAQKNKTHYALLFLDLDQFKVVNDTCGHGAGDELLKQITTALQGEVRSRDTLARLGGDEFGLLLDHCSLSNAEEIADKLRLVVKNNRFAWKDKVFDIGVSIGAVQISEFTTDINHIMSTADMACYMAKDLGRNQVYVYTAEDEKLIRQQGEMNAVSKITKAMDEERFELFYQSIMPLSPDGGMHFEILIRMRNEEGFMALPGEFLPAAERFGLMPSIDKLVIRNTLHFFSHNIEIQKALNLCCINLSGKSLDQHDFLEYVVSEIERSGLPHEKICFEITESAAVSNLERAIVFISTLRRFGCRFALDDFGTGMSSFSYLKQFPVDFLKIDGSFIQDIDTDPIKHAMVKSIHEVAKVMNMKTIAEFVENDAVLQTLADIGIEYAQGYHIQKPTPLNDLSIPDLASKKLNLKGL